MASICTGLAGSLVTLILLQGLKGGPVRPPLVNVSDDELIELSKMLETWQPIL
jgi:dihydrodipicolinate synthase/N-acetylneuraminate lyase